MQSFTKQELAKRITGKLRRNFGRDVDDATPQQVFKACAMVVRDIMSSHYMETEDQIAQTHARQVHYLSLEFLMGRSLMKNAFNLGILEPLKEAIESLGFSAPDLFELEPVEPYTDADLDWTDSGSRVVYEHENPEEQAVELEATTVDDWDSYSTVYIGYPIWWGQAAWPVNAFIEANDFTGKTVIPFCTSSSSGLGQSGELLAEMAGTGDWQEGVRFSSNVSEEDVQSWLESLGE